ncbi:MAG: nucleotidyltransferase family protein [Gemmatimonadota bacterium]|jgi:CTP:molybdopterin cytidylyltransferase MocA
MVLWRRRSVPPPSPSVRHVPGVIPCAGESSRMGRPKALLDAGGRSFLSAVVGALVGGGCDPVLVVVAPEQEEIVRKAEAAGAAVLVNPDPGEGPITSLRLVLERLGEDAPGVAFCPVDHPLLTAETVAQLLDAYRESETALALPVVGEKRGHPVIFGPALFPELKDPGLEGGARTVVHRHLDEALLIPVHDPGAVTDIDTPEQYRAAFFPGPPR